MRERLAYLHLPKAAGTSIRSALSAYYPSDVTVPYSFDRHLFGDEPRITEITEPVFLGDPSEFRAFRYMEGHWTLPSMEAAFESPDIVCLLREPRARFLSHYSFWRSWPDWMHELWEPYRAARYAGLRLSAYCTEPGAAHQTDNLMTRLILGPHELIPDRGFIRADDIARVVAAACTRLDAIGHADVIERGDATYVALEAWFGSPLSRERLNETDLGAGEPMDLVDALDTATMALLYRRNSADMEIWRHVARRSMSDAEARSLAESTFARSVTRLVGAADGDAAAVSVPAFPWSATARSGPRSLVDVARRGARSLRRQAASAEKRLRNVTRQTR